METQVALLRLALQSAAGGPWTTRRPDSVLGTRQAGDSSSLQDCVWQPPVIFWAGCNGYIMFKGVNV